MLPEKLGELLAEGKLDDFVELAPSRPLAAQLYNSLGQGLGQDLSPGRCHAETLAWLRGVFDLAVDADGRAQARAPAKPARYPE